MRDSESPLHMACVQGHRSNFTAGNPIFSSGFIDRGVSLEADLKGHSSIPNAAHILDASSNGGTPSVCSFLFLKNFSSSIDGSWADSDTGLTAGTRRSRFARVPCHGVSRLQKPACCVWSCRRIILPRFSSDDNFLLVRSCKMLLSCHCSIIFDIIRLL